MARCASNELAAKTQRGRPNRETEPRGFYSKKIRIMDALRSALAGATEREQQAALVKTSRYFTGNLADLTRRIAQKRLTIPVVPVVEKNTGKICKQLVAYVFVVC